MVEVDQTSEISELNTIQEIEQKKGFVKTEVNFLQFPYGSLDKNCKNNLVTYKSTISDTQNQKIVNLEWTVGGGMFGLPGPSAIELVKHG